MSEQRVLPAKVYDAVQLSAEIYGGIGAGRVMDGRVPRCFIGLARDAGVLTRWAPALSQNVAGIDYRVNDAAVWSVRHARIRRGVADWYTNGRVTFREWCDCLGVIRGPDLPPTFWERFRALFSRRTRKPVRVTSPSPARGSADAESEAAPGSLALVSR